MAHLIYSLTDLETARDDLMFELHKQPQQSPTDNAVSYINNLSQDYIKQAQPNPTDKVAKFYKFWCRGCHDNNQQIM